MAEYYSLEGYYEYEKAFAKKKRRKKSNEFTPQRFFVIQEVEDGYWKQISDTFETYPQAIAAKAEWDAEYPDIPNVFIVATAILIKKIL